MEGVTLFLSNKYLYLQYVLLIMGKTEQVTVSLPKGLKDKARDHGICVSRVASKAIQEKVQKLESKDGENSADA
jgi:post-segregation antitoxin (ccd killing protein)